MDAVGRPLAAVAAELAARRIPYTVAVTRPDRKSFPLLEDDLYVVRQTTDAEGVAVLLAAARMGREG